MKSNQKQKNIPNDWAEVGLADIGSFSKGAGISKDQLVNNGNNAVRYGELYTTHNFQIKKIYSFIPDKIIPETKKIKYGDILFAGSGETIDEIGKSAAYLLKENCYAGGDLIIFSPKDANSLFLSYFLNVGEARKKLRELGQGQSIVHIYKSDIEKLRVHLPSLSEQNRIVSVLGTWDKAIEKMAKKIEYKKNIKKGLMQRLMAGELRLVGFSNQWQTLKLGQVIENSGARNKKLKYKRVLSVTNKHGFVLPENQFARVIASEDLSNYKIVFNGEFAYNPSRINVGSISRLDKFENGILSPMYIVFKTKPEVSSDYIFHWIHSSEARGRIKSCVSGSVRESVDFKSLASIKIKLPSFTEQEGIAAILNKADKEIVLLNKKLKQLKAQKNYLLNNLITGAIRTPEMMKI
jgi:type I restriction enzyme S subunit